MSDYDRDHEPDDDPDTKAFSIASLILCGAAAFAAPLMLILIYDFLRAFW